ncbi:MAG: multicopper polyphenol oxidase [Actinobacteria bacterium HGW-Actinobacteria-4]|nr:MAG: multicopper polyphenol oxidase [Actinobacteria bacterium HGW-Actinobacteria-4]
MVIDAGLNVPAFFTSRAGGISSAPYASLNVALHVGDDARAVAANRKAIEDLAGVPVSFMVPNHGITVAHVSVAGQEPAIADVLITTTPGVAIASQAADCVPVLLHDKASGAVAAVHAGREGLYAGVLDAAVAALLDIRGGWTARGEMSASIGPAICGRCYEVPAQLRQRIAERHPIATASTSWGKPALDIPRAVEARLGQLGFSHITRQRACTFEDPAYFSHRRDGTTGRQTAVIVCP